MNIYKKEKGVVEQNHEWQSQNDYSQTNQEAFTKRTENR